MFELLLMAGDVVVRVQPVRGAPVHIGRAPDNELVLQHARVSGHHAMVWVEAEQLKVRDLGSRNGTFVGDTRVTATSDLAPGDTLKIGDIAIRIRASDAPEELDLRPLQLVDVAARSAVPIRSDRVTIGSHPDCDLVLPDGPERAATLLVFDGELLLGIDDVESELGIDAEFGVGGRTLRVERGAPTLAPTEGVETTAYPYTLRARLDGDAGPEATLSDGARQLQVRHEQRATLLYLLARQAQADAHRPAKARGWMSDEDVAVGLWGRDAWELGGNTLHVLVHRTRAELREAGFDPWCIEKRRRRIRVRVGVAEAL